VRTGAAKVLAASSREFQTARTVIAREGLPAVIRARRRLRPEADKGTPWNSALSRPWGVATSRFRRLEAGGTLDRHPLEAAYDKKIRPTSYRQFKTLSGVPRSSLARGDNQTLVAVGCT
jgi:hypothetical protein